MLPPDRAHSFETAPLGELFGVLLRQLRRPLAAHGLKLTDTDAERLGQACAAGESMDSAVLVMALVGVVTESEGVLAGMGVSFIEALDRPMDQIAGWETTAEFLEVANEKANAELRIALGAALALVFGERRFAPYLLHLAEGDYGDESVIARRALLFAAGAAPDAPDTMAQVRRWLLEK